MSPANGYWCIMEINQVSKSEFKAKALQYFRQVELSGESVIVTDHGRPTLEIRPYRSAERTPLDMLRGSVVCYENPTDPVDEHDWEAAR
jgi:antitoxin (DNA-binding transcriptional repressor) of toxin-antitoxin stability system